MLMGWDTSKISVANMSDRQLCGLVGESLHLGCASLVFGLVFLNPKAPWWSPIDGPKKDQPAEDPPAASSPKKRRRRFGLLRRTSSCC